MKLDYGIARADLPDLIRHQWNKMTMETRSRYWGRIPYVTGSSQVIFVCIGGTHVGQSRAGGCFRGIGANAAQVQVQCASHGCSRGLHRCAATADWRPVATAQHAAGGRHKHNSHCARRVQLSTPTPRHSPVALPAPSFTERQPLGRE